MPNMVAAIAKKALVPLIVLGIIVLIVTLLASCTEIEHAPACPAPKPVTLEAQCPFGQPVHCIGVERDCFLPLGIVTRPQYTLAYSYRYSMPVWACETVSASELFGTAQRKGYFARDPLLSSVHQVTDRTFVHSGFDRSHLIPAADQQWNQLYMDDTFYMSNVVPMRPEFNRGIWAQFEQWVRSWVSTHGDAYVITGVAHTSLDTGTTTIDTALVPTHFYKILVSKRGTKDWHAIGFMFDHYDDAKAPYDWRDYVVSIGLIESMANTIVMPNIQGSNDSWRMKAQAANFDLWVK